VPPSSTTDPIVGRYRLNLTVGAGCEGIPQAAKDVAYTADVEPDAGGYSVTLYDAVFWGNLSCRNPWSPQSGTATCNRFRASRTDDALRFDFMSPDE